MSSNFTQHNPTAANQLSDSDFAGNSLTTGGIGTDAIMPSEWMNARWYEDSTFVAAFALALSNKGYNPNKDNFSTLVAVLGNVITNNDLKPAQVTVAFSPTPTFDCNLSNGFRINLTASVTSSFVINTPATGTIVTFFIVSASPGNFTFVWPSNVFGARNVQTESHFNYFSQQFISDGTNLYEVESFIDVLSNLVINAQSTANTGVTNAAAAATAAAAAQATANSKLPNTLTQFTPGNNFGTIYQNTTLGDTRVVVVGSIMFGVGHAGTLLARCGPSAGALSTVDIQTITNSSGYGGVRFTVPQGWFYQVITGPGIFPGDSNAATLTNWTEWSYV